MTDMRAHVSLFAAAAALLLAGDALAAPPWVERSLTLPSGNWAFDVGGGLGHVPDTTAFGVNLEAAVGITEHVELGVRTGLRPADEPGRAIEPDLYGRLFDRQYFDGGDSPVANPEIRVRWAFLSGSVAEIGLEGRFIAPIGFELKNSTWAIACASTPACGCPSSSIRSTPPSASACRSTCGSRSPASCGSAP